MISDGMQKRLLFSYIYIYIYVYIYIYIRIYVSFNLNCLGKKLRVLGMRSCCQPSMLLFCIPRCLACMEIWVYVVRHILIFRRFISLQRGSSKLSGILSLKMRTKSMARPCSRCWGMISVKDTAF